MDGIQNFRGLGGIPTSDGGAVPDGRFYRSGHLAHATDADLDRLGELGVRTIVDLRTDGDIRHDGPDRVPGGVEHVRVPVGDDAGRSGELRALIGNGEVTAEARAMLGEGRARAWATDGSRSFVTRPEPFRPAFEVILDPACWPVLWHCSAGKDRAGWVASAILLAHGVPEEHVVSHYVASNDRAGVVVPPSSEMLELMAPFIWVHEEYVRAQIDAVVETHGDIRSFFREAYDLDVAVLGSSC